MPTLARHEIRHIFVYCSAMAQYVMRAPHARRSARATTFGRKPPGRMRCGCWTWSTWTPRSGAPTRPTARLVGARGIRPRRICTLLAFERARGARLHPQHFSSTRPNGAISSRLAFPERRAATCTGWIDNGVDLSAHFSPALTFADPFPPIAPALPTGKRPRIVGGAPPPPPPPPPPSKTTNRASRQRPHIGHRHQSAPPPPPCRRRARGPAHAAAGVHRGAWITAPTSTP